MDILSYPFRLGLDGRMATVEQGSDQEAAEAIEIIIGSRIDERPMCWPFGIPDPTFAGLEPDDINSALQMWGPTGVTVTDIDTEIVDEYTEKSVVSFIRGPEGDAL